MTSARLTAFAFLAVLVVSTTSGCSSSNTKKYTAATACAMPSSTVRAVLDTDRFKTSDVEPQALPLSGDTPFSDFGCTVTANDDNRIIVIARIAPANEVADRIAKYRRFGGTFDHAGGVGVADADGGGWGCGGVQFDLTIQGDLKSKASDITTLVKSFADRAGCWNQTGSGKG